MFSAFMNNGQLIFGEAEFFPSVDQVAITNPMTIVMAQQHPSHPPQAMVVPVLPGDLTRVSNKITYRLANLAQVEGDITSDLEQKYIQSTSRIQIAGKIN